MRPVERLVAGEDLLEFRDGTTGPLIHLHTARYSQSALKRSKSVRPIHVPALSLGGSVPVRPLIVSGDVHVLAGGRLVNRVTELEQVLLPIKALVGYNGIAPIIPAEGITFYHPATAGHQVLRVEGVLCETLYVGDASPDGLRDSVPKETHASAPILPRVDPDTAQRLAAKLMAKNRTLAPEESESG